MGQFAHGYPDEIASNAGILLEHTELMIRKLGLESQCRHFVVVWPRTNHGPLIGLSPINVTFGPSKMIPF